jgi:phage terminase large subunit-like protein
MAKNIKKRLIGSYRTKTKKTKRSQNKGLEIGRQRERLKTGEVENFPIQEYQRDIIQFSEKEVFLPEKKEQLIKIETWEREVFTDCFYKNRPRLILISLAKKNGKSTFSAMVLNWFLITQEPGEIYICSNSKDQSNFITYRKIVSMIKKNPKLNEQVRIYIDRIENIKTGSILRCLSSSYRSSAGLNCLLICIDELASFDTDSLKFFFEELQLSPTYKFPLILVTSTAGRSEEGLLWDLIKESEKGNTSESYFYVKQGNEANPSSFVTKKYLNSQEHKPGMRPNLFKRLHKNLWVSEEESFVNDEDFRACIDYKLIQRPKIKIPIWVGLDVGYASDYTAVCGVGKSGNKIFSVDHKIYIPTKVEGFRFDDVKRYLIELSKIYDIQSLLFDPYQAIQLSQDLEKEGINMVKLTPTQSNSVAFSQCLFNLIKGQGINFYESEEIRLSLINCKVVYSGRGWRIVKKSGTKKIDLAIALAMASYGAVIAPEGSNMTEQDWKDMKDMNERLSRMPGIRRPSSYEPEDAPEYLFNDW